LLFAELAAARALVEEAGAKIDAAVARGPALSAEDRGAAAIIVYEAKLQAARAGLDVTQRVFDLMGARATSERYGFDRRWRDVRVHSLHDPLAYKAKEIGAYRLLGTLPQPSNYS
jgi:alkylation response protein AidB-like acyl-CoA dehydrogenase